MGLVSQILGKITHFFQWEWVCLLNPVIKADNGIAKLVVDSLPCIWIDHCSIFG